MVKRNPVWVIILSWNGWREIIPCLKSLRRVDDPPIHVLVVDNGSTDDTLEHLHAFQASTEAPRFAILENGANLGFAGGMNVGMKKALEEKAEWILLLNQDTTVDPDFLRGMLKATATDEKIGMVNPKILLADPPDYIWSVGGEVNGMLTRGTHIGYGERDSGQYDLPEVRDTEYATGGCLLVKSSLIRDIGLLSDAYFLYYEDVEWSLKARRSGWRCVITASAKIWHKGAASSKEHSRAYIRYHVRNGLLLARRMGTPSQIILAYLYSIPRAAWQVVKWLLYPEKRRWAVAILLGIRDAWLNRTGKIPATYS